MTAKNPKEEAHQECAISTLFRGKSVILPEKLARLDGFLAMRNMPGMSKVVYSVHIEPSKAGFYVTVPGLPECRTTARTFDLALNKAKTHIQKFLKSLTKARKQIPIESQKVPPLCLPIEVTLPKGARTILASDLLRSGRPSTWVEPL